MKKRCNLEEKRVLSATERLGELRAIAVNRGGSCLSQSYKNAHTKLEWKCGKGHRWLASPDKVKRGTWCPTCRKLPKATIEQMHALARSREGFCLSDNYKNTDSKLLWRCAKGHEWAATPYKVKKGSWCPTCGGTKTFTIGDAQEFAKSIGGACLSTEYVNNVSKLEWRCDKGHTFIRTFSAVRNGVWCPECRSPNRIKPSQVLDIIKQRGGKCLTKTIKNSCTKLTVVCQHGHVWHPTGRNLVLGHWCRICAGSMPLGIEAMHKLAKERGGKCLSTDYVNNSTKLKWQCGSGHQWESVPATITTGGWCPECSFGTGEKIVKAYFEQLFGAKFIKVRPNWLINDRGNLMELDGYNKELRLAFEHQGLQHYQITPPFVRNERQLAQRQRDDELKARICEQHNVRLLAVPQLGDLLSIDDLTQYILDWCDSIDVAVSPDNLAKEIDLSEVYNQKAYLLDEIRSICASHGGECLSDYYISATSKLRFRCGCGHEWETTPYAIRTGSWCPLCRDKQSRDIQRTSIVIIKEMVQANNGTLRSKSYDSCNQKLEITCDQGHDFSMSLRSLSSGRWCSICRRNLTTLEKLREKIESQHGHIVSCDFIDSKSNVTIQCHNGHEWTARAFRVMGGNWCKRCSARQTGALLSNSLEEAQALAESKEGKLLSTIYQRNTLPLTWQCKFGHIWDASYSVIRRGQWCKVCGKAERSAKELEKYQALAQTHGGKCLSSQYVEAKVKLDWVCSKGHLFTATPDNVKQGRWCSKCKGDRISKTKRLKQAKEL